MLVWGMEELQEYWLDQHPPKWNELNQASPKQSATKIYSQQEKQAIKSIQKSFRSYKFRQSIGVSAIQTITKCRHEDDVAKIVKMQALVRGKQSRRKTLQKIEEQERSRILGGTGLTHTQKRAARKIEQKEQAQKVTSTASALATAA